MTILLCRISGSSAKRSTTYKVTREDIRHARKAIPDCDAMILLVSAFSTHTKDSLKAYGKPRKNSMISASAW